MACCEIINNNHLQSSQAPKLIRHNIMRHVRRACDGGRDARTFGASCAQHSGPHARAAGLSVEARLLLAPEPAELLVTRRRPHTSLQRHAT
jgi:hypothetical protein